MANKDEIKTILDVDEYVSEITKAHGSDADASAEAVERLIAHNRAMIDTIENQDKRYSGLNDKYTKMALRIATGDSMNHVTSEEDREHIEEEERKNKIESMLE